MATIWKRSPWRHPLQLLIGAYLSYSVILYFLVAHLSGYEAMRYLAGRSDKGSEGHMLGRQFRINDLGLRCMAEHVTRAITLSLLQPEATGGTRDPAAPRAGAPVGSQVESKPGAR